MRKPLGILVALVCIGLVSFAWAEPRSGARPDRFQPVSLDSGLVQTVSPTDGRVWSAWAYRNGAEFDIAVSTLEEDGNWSEPLFFGGSDGIDQLQPAIVSDDLGSFYLAFAQGDPSRILVSVLPAGGSNWTTPQAVTGPALGAHSPSMRVIGSRLVLAFRAGRAGVEILDFPLAGPGTHDGGFTDGPDPVGSPSADKPADDGDSEGSESNEPSEGMTFGNSPSNNRR